MFARSSAYNPENDQNMMDMMMNHDKPVDLEQPFTKDIRNPYSNIVCQFYVRHYVMHVLSLDMHKCMA